VKVQTITMSECDDSCCVLVHISPCNTDTSPDLPVNIVRVNNHLQPLSSS
jgi:hypothetical protein